MDTLPSELLNIIHARISIIDRYHLRATCKHLYVMDANVDNEAVKYSFFYKCGLWTRKHPIFCALVRVGFDLFVTKHYIQFGFAPHRENVETGRWEYQLNLTTRFNYQKMHQVTIECTPAPDYKITSATFNREQACHHSEKETVSSLHELIVLLKDIFDISPAYSCYSCACKERWFLDSCKEI